MKPWKFFSAVMVLIAVGVMLGAMGTISSLAFATSDDADPASPAPGKDIQSTSKQAPAPAGAHDSVIRTLRGQPPAYPDAAPAASPADKSVKTTPEEAPQPLTSADPIVRTLRGQPPVH